MTDFRKSLFTKTMFFVCRATRRDRRQTDRARISLFV
jgi:hypothetical protein